MMRNVIGRLALFILFLFAGVHVFAADKNFPEKPNPPRLVNDFAHMMSPQDEAQLEEKLRIFENSTSNEITVVTITSLGDYDISDYAIMLGKAWGVGKSGKNNGIVVIASLQDHKINISTGKGLEGALTDLTCGRIIRNEMVPAFKDKNYYLGFSKAADAIIAATKGEYKADDKKGHIPFTLVIVGIIFVIFIISLFGRRGGGGGNYMSGGGLGNFAAGMLLGDLLGGRGGGSGGGLGGGGDSGFGGFGGGDFGGGGASGSW